MCSQYWLQKRQSNKLGYRTKLRFILDQKDRVGLEQILKEHHSDCASSQRSKHRSAYNNSLAKRESDSVTPPIPSFSFRRRVYFFNLKKYYFFKLKKFSRSMIYKEVEFTAPQVIFYLLCSPRNTSRKRYILIATVHTGGLNKRLCTVYTKNNQYLYLFLW